MQVIATDRPGAKPAAQKPTSKIKLSSPSKMKGTCKTWSTLAVTHCPGSRGPDGQLVEACDKCYADKGMYKMPNSIKVREHNALDWQRDDWVSDMVEAISGQAHFRFFDSGDMYHIDLAHKILAICKALPETRFWIPTRMHKLAKFKPVIARLNSLPNVVVRYSSDSTQGKRVRGKNTSTIIRNDGQARGAHICPATIPGNTPNCKANGCAACWEKSITVIAYHFH